MNPYAPPTSDLSPTPGSGSPTGVNCRHCGSPNTYRSVLRRRPSLLWLLMFGWLFFLFRTAVVPKTAMCSDCGASSAYRTTANYLALIAVIILLGLTAISIASES